jgi:hypothetical protein
MSKDVNVFGYTNANQLELPILHQFLTSQFDDFVFIRFRAGSNKVVYESFLFFCCGEVDELNDGSQYIHFFRYFFR